MPCPSKSYRPRLAPALCSIGSDKGDAVDGDAEADEQNRVRK
jgi:hypothetical protein